MNEQKKKVIIIGTAYPLRGGLAAYNERLAREYQKQGDKVTIYTFSLQYPNFLFPGKSQYSTDPPPDDLDILVRINSINPINWFRIGKEINRLKADLVIIKFWIPFMAPCLGTIARIIRRNKGSQVISIIDNIIPHEKRTGDRILAKFWVKSVDGFIAMSASVMEDLSKFDTLKKKVYCPHPLYDNFGEKMKKSTARDLLGLTQTEKIVLFFGFIRDYKGLDLLLQSLADFRLREMKIRAIIAGEFYTDSRPYFDLIRQLKLEDIVIMHNDFIPDHEVAKYFCSADVVVQPYKSATQSGITQIAYHFEVPIITTNVGGLAEIIPDGKVGYVVEPETEKITEAIIRFYRSKKEDDFRNQIKTEKTKYTWESLVKAINSI